MPNISKLDFVPAIVNSILDEKTPAELRLLKTQIYARTNSSQNSNEILSEQSQPIDVDKTSLLDVSYDSEMEVGAFVNTKRRKSSQLLSKDSQQFDVGDAEANAVINPLTNKGSSQEDEHEEGIKQFINIE